MRTNGIETLEVDVAVGLYNCAAVHWALTHVSNIEKLITQPVTQLDLRYL